MLRGDSVTRSISTVCQPTAQFGQPDLAGLQRPRRYLSPSPASVRKELSYAVSGLKPESAAVQYNLGWSYSELERYAEALKPLSEAVRLRPEDADAHRELGYAYLGLKQFANAASSLKRAISLNPQAALPYYYLGIVNLRMGNKTEALEQYRALQRLDPERAKKLSAEINK